MFQECPYEECLQFRSELGMPPRGLTQAMYPRKVQFHKLIQIGYQTSG